MNKDNRRLHTDLIRYIRYGVKHFADTNQFPEPKPVSLGKDQAIYRIGSRDLSIPLVYMYRRDGGLDHSRTVDHYTVTIPLLWKDYDVTSDQDIDLSSMVITEFGDKEQQ